MKSLAVHTSLSSLFIAAIAGSLGCSAEGLALSEPAPEQSDEPQQVSSSTQALSGGHSDVRRANRAFCPPGSGNKKLKLAGVQLVREEGIPLAYAGFNNVEGPLWNEGALYYTNMGNRPCMGAECPPGDPTFVMTNQTTIWRWEPGSAPQVWLGDTQAGTNGHAVDFDGNLVAARQLDGSVSFIDWDTQAITAIAGTWEDKRFNSPNDLTIGHDGTIWFTDPNWNTPSNVDPSSVQGGGAPGSLAPGQRIYRIDSDGIVSPSVATELVVELRDKPNGIMLSLDEKQLLVGSLRGLWAFDVIEGSLKNPEQILDTPIDGLGKDCTGNIYVTTTRPIPDRTDGQVIVILDDDNDEIGQLNVPLIHITTNVAFGGDDMQTLYVTGLTDPGTMCGAVPCLPAGIYSAHLNVKGFPY